MSTRLHGIVTTSASAKALVRFVGTTGQVIDGVTVTLENDGRIASLTDPANPQDAATKAYVDSADSDDVVGPASSVASEVALFDGTTGKLIKRATGTGVVRVASGVYGTPGNVVESEITLADNTTDNVSTSAHGFAPKAPSDATKFLNGANPPAWTTPSGSGGTVTTTGSPANGDLTKFSGATSVTNWSAAATSVVGRSANSAGTPADIAASANQQILGRRSDVLGFTEISDFGRWSILTNGDPAAPEVIFDANGDVVSIWEPL